MKVCQKHMSTKARKTTINISEEIKEMIEAVKQQKLEIANLRNRSVGESKV